MIHFATSLTAAAVCNTIVALIILFAIFFGLKKIGKNKPKAKVIDLDASERFYIHDEPLIKTFSKN